MTPEEARLRFRQWLIDHELESDVAHAILETVPPFDWSEIARQSELDALRRDMTQRLDGIDHRLDGIDQRFDGIDQRFDGIDQRFEAMTAMFEAMRTSVEAQMVALEGRLSLRWMETTRIIVFTMVALFVAITGVIISIT